MSQWYSDSEHSYISENILKIEKFIGNSKKEYVDETKFKKNPSIMVSKWSVKIK